MSDPSVPGFFNTIGAGATVVLSATQGNTTGKVGDYLDSITVSGAAAATTLALIDGATTLITATITPSSTTTLFFRMYSKSGAWSITTGANVSAIAVGKFT